MTSSVLKYGGLTGQSVSELQYEHSHKLPNSVTNLQRQIERYSVQEYPVFLQTQSTLTSLSSHLGQLQAALQKDFQNTSAPKNDGKCFETLQDFKASLETFQNSDQLYQSKKHSNKLALDNFGHLVSLLEIPQLTETCVRNDLYTEALELDNAVKNMCRGNPDLILVEQLKNETQKCISWLINKLLSTLRSRACNVPVCIKVVGLLRRMQVCRSERELRIMFLQSRCYYIQDRLKRSLGRVQEDERAYDFLSSITDAVKTQMFDIIMQYQSSFTLTQQQQLSSPSTLDSSGSFDDNDDVLPSCTVHLLYDYLQILSHHLQKCDQSALNGESCAKLLEHSMYCGHRLAKIGADFRPTISQMFIERVIRFFQINMKDAVHRFSHSMQNYRWQAPSKTLNLQQQQHQDGNNEVLSPPRSLLAHLPLAELLNDGLSALNELRHCCPMECRTNLIRIFCDEFLTEVVQVLLSVSETYPFDDRERSVFRSVCKLVNVDLVRYLVNCFERTVNEHVMGDERIITCTQTLATLASQ
jgi:hypothetical protein